MSQRRIGHSTVLSFLPLALLVVGFGLASSPALAAEEAADEATDTAAKGSAAKAATAVAPSYRAAVKQFLEVQNTADVMGEQMTYAMAEQTLGAMAQTGIEITEPIQKIVLDESRKEFGSRFGDIEFLTDLFAPHYVDQFSEKEIREITAFYQSPIGKKMMTAMPSVGQSTYVSLQEASYAMMPGFQLNVTNRLKAAGVQGMP